MIGGFKQRQLERYKRTLQLRSGQRVRYKVVTYANAGIASAGANPLFRVNSAVCVKGSRGARVAVYSPIKQRCDLSTNDFWVFL